MKPLKKICLFSMASSLLLSSCSTEADNVEGQESCMPGQPCIVSESSPNDGFQESPGLGIYAGIAAGVAVVGALASGGSGGSGGNGSSGTGTTAVPEDSTSVRKSCLFNGGSLAEGETVVAYEKSNVASDQVCSSQTRTCVQGELTGSYQFSSCSVTGVLDCQFNGLTIANGTSTTAFESGSVDFGKSCKSELRLCTNGILSGTYDYASCTVESAEQCEFNGQSIVHGSSVVAYSSQSVSSSETCSSETRICNDGSLSGSFNSSTCTAQSSNSSWTKQFGTSNQYESQVGYGVAVDSSGNVFVTGSTEGGLDGNSNAGGTDLFLIKFDNNGDRQWTRQYGTGGTDIGYDVALDSTGNAYVTGPANGKLLLAKYDTDGNRQWLQQYASSSTTNYTNDVTPLAITLDQSGNIFVAGKIWGNFEGFSDLGASDLFVIKFDSNGTRIWTQQVGSGSYDEAHGIEADANGSVTITGFTQGSLDGSITGFNSEIILIKFDNNGNQIFLKQRKNPGSNKSAYANDLKLAPDSIYVTGSYDNNVLTVKYDNNGNELWAKELGSNESEEALALTFDEDNDPLIVGYTYGNLDGNTNSGSADLFFVQYSSSGSISDSYQDGTKYLDKTRDIEIDSIGNKYMTGETAGSLDGLRISTGDQYSDGFLRKIGK